MLRLPCLLPCLAASLITVAGAQSPLAPRGASLAAPLVEPAIMAAWNPAKWIKQPIVSRFPVEIMAAAVQETLGIDPRELTDAKFAVTLDPVAGPLIGMSIADPGEGSLDRVGRMFSSRPDPEDPSIYFVDRANDIVLTKPDAGHWYLGHRRMLSTLTDPAAGPSAAVSAMNRWPDDETLRVVVDVPLVRPILVNFLINARRSLRPALQPVLDLPDLCEQLQLHLDFDGTAGGMALTFGASDADAATQVEAILNETLTAAVQLLQPQLLAMFDIESAPPVMQQSMNDYADRTAAWIVQNLHVTRDQNNITLSVRGDVGVASTIALAGYALPRIAEVIATMQPPGRTDDLKQILLAMHNYHSAYRKLPGPGIRDDDGKLLLSWRVALLPFHGEIALWEEFRKDEPWDSEHNLPLAQRMPAIYRSDSANLAKTLTTYHAVVGEGLAISPEGESRFRQFLDGLSNTLLVVESDADHAVIWTQPEDMAFDLDDPLAGLPDGPDGFLAAFADGSTHVLFDDIDVELFRRILTRAGMEVVDRDAF